MYIFIVLSTTFVKYKFILQKTKLDKQPRTKEGRIEIGQKIADLLHLTLSDQVI